MKGRKRTILVLCVVASVLAGCNEAATAQERQGDKRGAEAPSVEFYVRNFGARLNAEAKCLKNPDLANTEMCINARKAANQIRAEIGMRPEYPEVENGQR